MASQKENLPQFLATEGRSHKLVEFLQRALQRLAAEQSEVLSEAQSLAQKVEHIKGIIHAQQVYAKQVPFRERVHLGQLIEDVILLHSESFQKHSIEIRVDSGKAPTITVEKAKLLQVIDNIVKNAIESIVASGAAERRIRVRVETPDAEQIRISVSDTGGGIRHDHLERIFSYGFTTKATGNGFGLHASALAIAGAGGRIFAESAGVGQGATFVVELPCEKPEAESGKAPTNTESASESGVSQSLRVSFVECSPTVSGVGITSG